MKDPNWTRWIAASIAKHFDAKRGTYNLYIEGFERTTAIEGAELRINGPYIEESTKDHYLIDIGISILINIAPNDQDAYSMHRAIGVFVDAFDNAINVYKYGTDGNGLLGCLVLISRIEVNQYQQINPDIRMYQSTVDGQYQMRI